MCESKHDQITLDKKIEYHQQLLDRWITFITACDNKASIALAIDGVMIGALAQKMSTVDMESISQKYYSMFSFSIAALILAAVLLLAVIFPRISPFPQNSFLIKCKESIDTNTNYLGNLISQIEANARIYSGKCLLCNLALISMALGAIVYLLPLFL